MHPSRLNRGVLFLSALGWALAGAVLSIVLTSWPTVEAQIGPPVRLRKYYLSQNTAPGSNALEACAPGYHMASLWEILDPSNLAYDTTLGLTTADSGLGPPTDRVGWIRNGRHTEFGSNNCDAWSAAFGTAITAHLERDWTEEGMDISPWEFGVFECNTQVRVWCVQDIP